MWFSLYQINILVPLVLDILNHADGKTKTANDCFSRNFYIH